MLTVMLALACGVLTSCLACLPTWLVGRQLDRGGNFVRQHSTVSGLLALLFALLVIGAAVIMYRIFAADQMVIFSLAAILTFLVLQVLIAWRSNNRQ